MAKIVIASGKGGTGKTTVSVSLAMTAAEGVQLLDCDVEAPNCHLFVPLDESGRGEVVHRVPEVDPERCNGCGKCAHFCQFNALAALPTKVEVFAELCHGCGGCALVCPQRAIREVKRPLGAVVTGSMRGVPFAQGRLVVGESRVPPVIEAVKRHALAGTLTIMDAPPGTSCPAVETMKGCDYVVLVTEPTPFGLHDLRMAVDTARQLELSCGVVINRSTGADGLIEDYCAREGVAILAKLPDERRVAEAYARGRLAVDEWPEWRERFEELLGCIREATGEPKEACHAHA